MGKQSENNEALNSEKQKRAFKLANAFMLTQNTCALVAYLWAMLYMRGLQFTRGPRVNRWDEKSSRPNLK